MIILSNGAPKTGTHALVKAIELLGIPRDDSSFRTQRTGEDLAEGEMREGLWTGLGHFYYRDRPKVDKIVHIVRDPRNVMISWLRWVKTSVHTGLIAAAIRGEYASGGLKQVMEEFFGYLDDPDVLTVQFEDLISDEATIRSIATYLGMPYIDGAFEGIWGGTKTFSDTLSEWEKDWSPILDDVWAEQDGPAIEKRLGYGTGN